MKLYRILIFCFIAIIGLILFRSCPNSTSTNSKSDITIKEETINQKIETQIFNIETNDPKRVTNEQSEAGQNIINNDFTLSKDTLELSSPFNKGNFFIYGKVTGFENGKLIYLKEYDLHTNNQSKTTILKKTKIKDGSFVFSGEISQPRFVTIATTPTNIINSEDLSMSFFLEDTVYQINLNGNDTLITGGNIQKQLNIWRKYDNLFSKNINSLLIEFNHLKKEQINIEEQKFIKQTEELQYKIKKLNEKRDSFIVKYPDLYISMWYLSWNVWRFGKPKVKEYYDILTPKYKSTEYAKSIEQFLKESKYFDLNDTISNFTLENIIGRSISLYDIKSKYIILDIWSKGCTGTYKLHEYFKSKINELKENQSKIISICVDTDYGRWITETKNRNITWINLIDNGNMQYFFSLEGLPTTYLLDENYVVIKRQLTEVDINELINN